MSKTNMRKFIAGSVTAAVVASAMAPAASADVKTFSDVKDSHWAATEIYSLVEQGIINGYPDGTFRPSVTLNRGQAANLLTSALELDIPSDLSAFKDLSSKSVFAEGAAATKAAGIFGGKENGTVFGAADELTREQMASVLVRAFDLEDTGEEVSFTDWERISPSHRENVKILAQNGITTGKADGSFDPKSAVSRAHFVTFLYRAMNMEEVKEIESLATLTDITVKEGEKVELPKVVEATYADDSKEDVAVKWEEADFSKPGVYNVEGTVEGTDLKAKVKVTVEEVAPAVESVEAINLNQVQVKFNKPLNKTAVSVSDFTLTDKVSNASVLDTSGDADDSYVTVSEDGKTATITLDDASTPVELTVDKNYELTVSKDIKFANGKTLGTAYKESFTAADSAAPKVDSVTANASGFVVKFNEPVSLTNKGVVKVNGVNLPASSVSAGADRFSVNVAYNTEAGKTYTVTTSAFEDLNGNQSAAEAKTASFSADNSAPAVQSVTAENEKTIKFVFSEEIAAGATATVSRNTTVFANGVSLVQDTDNDNVYYATLDANLADLYTSGTSSTALKVDLSSVKDASNNVTAASSHTVTVNKDVTAPSVVSENFDGTNYVLKFSEVLDASALDASGVIVTDENGALVSGVTFEVHDDKLATSTQEDGEYLIVKGLQLNKSYKISFPAGLVADTSLAGNETSAFTKTVTTGAVSNDTTAPTFTSVTPSVVSGKNVLTLLFNENLAASAKDLANFKLDGAALPEGSVAYLNAGTANTDQIVITLPASAVSNDGQYTLSYSNIKDLAGNTASSATKVVSLEDTVKPELTAAKVASSTTLELTFSEGINDTTIGTLADVVDDLQVTVNGVAIPGSAITGVATGETANDNKVVLTIAGYNLTNQTVKVTTVTGANTIADNSTQGNTVKTGTTVTAQ
ncbi:S-layer homology domain-containing protein [Bacillus infantis]|uniref:S-layer homology domain-containing protein n=1 Tax=Bacillus infantis TaxID=324767 RepID=UPI003CFB9F75